MGVHHRLVLASLAQFLDVAMIWKSSKAGVRRVGRIITGIGRPSGRVGTDRVRRLIQVDYRDVGQVHSELCHFQAFHASSESLQHSPPLRARLQDSSLIPSGGRSLEFANACVDILVFHSFEGLRQHAISSPDPDCGRRGWVQHDAKKSCDGGGRRLLKPSDRLQNHIPAGFAICSRELRYLQPSQQRSPTTPAASSIRVLESRAAMASSCLRPNFVPWPVI